MWWKWTQLIERYPSNLAMIINKTEKKYGDIMDMYEVLTETIKPNELSDDLINPNNNIIISTSNDNIIKRNLDGTISVVTNADINLSGTRALTNNISVLDIYPKIKIIVPAGILPVINKPDNLFYNNIYPFYKLEKRGGVDEIPQYIIYHDFIMTLFIDLDMIKRATSTILIKTGTELFNISFTPIYYIGSHKFPNIDKTYWIKNIEFYNTVMEVF